VREELSQLNSPTCRTTSRGLEVVQMFRRERHQCHSVFSVTTDGLPQSVGGTIYSTTAPFSPSWKWVSLTAVAVCCFGWLMVTHGERWFDTLTTLHRLPAAV